MGIFYFGLIILRMKKYDIDGCLYIIYKKKVFVLYNKNFYKN